MEQSLIGPVPRDDEIQQKDLEVFVGDQWILGALLHLTKPLILCFVSRRGGLFGFKKVQHNVVTT